MDVLFESLQKYYKNTEIMEKLLSILTGKDKISLRIIDWFVTNYSKKNNIYYLLYKDETTGNVSFEGKQTEFHKQFNTYHSYKSQLKSYSKKRFDPFCRWERIIVPYDGDNNMETTIGQLNFFRWAIENKIIDYISENYDKIENDMNKRNSSSRKKKETISENKTRKKREELSISACKCIKKETVNIIVKFDEI